MNNLKLIVLENIKELGEKVNRVYKYNTDVWQVVSGCLILISLILYI